METIDGQYMMNGVDIAVPGLRASDRKSTAAIRIIAVAAVAVAVYLHENKVLL